MLTPAENERLCRVGPGTPMGALLRRYWIPAYLSADLPVSTDPTRIRLLGEWFVAFRDVEGRVGFGDESCCHRGASLWLGRVEGEGIRCLYHGWKFGADGTILETPNLPPASPFRHKVRAPMYPVTEAGGIIWVYLGPPALQPPFPDYGFMHVPDANRVVVRMVQPVNWVQVLEGTVDPSHTGILHADHNPFGSTNEFHLGDDEEERLSAMLHADPAIRSADNAPALELDDTDFGFHAAAIREQLDGSGDRYVRVTSYVLPFFTLYPPADRVGAFCVPLSDTETAYISVTWDREAPVDPAPIRLWYGLDVPGAYEAGRVTADASNRFLQDRSRMDGSFTGLAAVALEDFAVTGSMGPIFDRSREHLVPSDVAVIRARRLLLQAATAVSEGREPPGLAAETAAIRAGEGLVAPHASWRSLVPGNRRIAARPGTAVMAAADDA